MKLISPLLKHVVYPGLSRSGVLNGRIGAGPVIITYHGVVPREYPGIDRNLDGNLVRADSFRSQLRLLRERYHVISPDQFLHWLRSGQELPPRSVLLTCDDGLRNTQTQMVPILREFGMSCLFFVTGASISGSPAMLWHEELHLMLLSTAGGFALQLPEIGLQASVAIVSEKHALCWRLVKALSGIDAPNGWSATYLHDPSFSCRFRVLDQAGLRELQSVGMTIGAHTLSHSMLSQLSSEAAWRDISESRCRLGQAVGQPVWALAYPFGYPRSVTRRERRMAEQAGFTCAFLNAGGGFGAAGPRFALPRVHVSAEMNLAEVEAHVSGFYIALRRRFLGETGEGAIELGA
jgi:peptidoglycan/xylan/chitin deacetylase (PgdA/CDA1 family)